MGVSKIIYNEIYEGGMEDAAIKFPFLSEGVHLRVLKAFSKNIGVFPKENTFYVATASTGEGNSLAVSLEETNSIEILNIIMRRETFEAMYLDEEDILKVKKFLEEENCKDIIY